MNADILTTRVAYGIAVITLGSARRIYFNEEMGDALTETLDGFAGDASVRIVVWLAAHQSAQPIPSDTVGLMAPTPLLVRMMASQLALQLFTMFALAGFRLRGINRRERANS